MKVINRSQQRNFKSPYTAEAETAMQIIGELNCSEINSLSIREVTLPAEAKLPLHAHSKSDEIYYMMFGSARMTAGNESVEIRRFDAVVVPAGVPHSLTNTGSSEAVFLEIGSRLNWNEDVQMVQAV